MRIFRRHTWQSFMLKGMILKSHLLMLNNTGKIIFPSLMASIQPKEVLPSRFGKRWSKLFANLKEISKHQISRRFGAAISVKVQEPVFESQTKTKRLFNCCSRGNNPNLCRRIFSRRNWTIICISTRRLLMRCGKIQRDERERKELKGIQKIARERAKKSKVHNRKLRDCRVHLNSKDKINLRVLCL